MNETIVFETAVTMAGPTSVAASYDDRREGPIAFGGHAAIDVLGHDDAHVGHVADGDGDAGQRHDVAVDAQAVHDDEAHGHRQRQRRQNRQRAAEVQQER